MLNEDRVKQLLDELTEMGNHIASLEVRCKGFGNRLLQKKFGENVPDVEIAVKAAPVIKQMRKDIAKYSRRIEQISQELNNGLQDMA